MCVCVINLFPACFPLYKSLISFHSSFRDPGAQRRSYTHPQFPTWKASFPFVRLRVPIEDRPTWTDVTDTFS